jgi:hypothetical protein
VRGVELANHQIHQAAHLVGGAGTGDVGRKFVVLRGPVGAVEGGVVEEVAQVAPSLVKDHQFLLFKIYIELGGHGHWVGGGAFAYLYRRHLNAALVEVVHLLAIGRKLRLALGAGRRGQLAGRGRVLAQLIERVHIQVGLVGDCGREQQPLAIGADALAAHIHAHRHQA